MIKKLLKWGCPACLFFMVACNESNWSKAEKDVIYERCRTEGGSRSYCNCYLQNAMEKFDSAEALEDIDFETAYELSLNCED